MWNDLEYSVKFGFGGHFKFGGNFGYVSHFEFDVFWPFWFLQPFLLFFYFFYFFLFKVFFVWQFWITEFVGHIDFQLPFNYSGHSHLKFGEDFEFGGHVQLDRIDFSLGLNCARVEPLVSVWDWWWSTDDGRLMMVDWAQREQGKTWGELSWEAATT